MSYTHLTPQERYVISHLKIAEFSLREIARRLGRHHTTDFKGVADFKGVRSTPLTDWHSLIAQNQIKPIKGDDHGTAAAD